MVVIFRRLVWLSMESSWWEALLVEVRSPCCQVLVESRWGADKLKKLNCDH